MSTSKAITTQPATPVLPSAPANPFSQSEIEQHARLGWTLTNAEESAILYGLVLSVLGIVLWIFTASFIAYPLMAFGILACMIGAFCLPLPPQRQGLCSQARVKKRLDTTIHKLDATHGWRPREGVVHPADRNDTYDRFCLEHWPEGSQVCVGIRRWSYDQIKQAWQPGERSHQQVFALDDETLCEQRAILEERAQQNEQAALEAWLTERQAAEEHQAASELARALNA